MENKMQQEARVWSRVTGADCPQPRLEQTVPVNAQWVAESIMQLQRSAAVYCWLAPRVCPGDRERLRAMARDKQRQIRELGAIYFVQTDRKFCPEAAQPPCAACVSELLREQHSAELAAAQRFSVPVAEEFAETFRCIRQESQRHAREVLCVLSRLL